MTISAAFTVNGAANPAAHTAAYGSTVTLAIVSSAGANSIAFSIVAPSLSTEPIPTVTSAGSPTGATATFALPADPGDGLGRSFLVKCEVSNDSETVTAYGVVGAVNAAGILPVAAGEEIVRSIYGWVDMLNSASAGASLFGSLNVKEARFGAVGDGTTDDTAAVQAAIAAATTNGGGVVLFPPGTYSVTGLTIPADCPVVLSGAGAFSTTIKLADSADANVIQTASIDTWTGTDTMPLPSAGGAVYGFQILDLTIDGNRDNNYSLGVADETEGVGVRIYAKSYVIDRCRVIQCAGIGVWSEYDAPATEYAEPVDANFGGIFNTTIIETNYEGLVFKGPADIKIDNLLVGKCHDPAATTTAALGTSLAFPGQSIDGVVLAGDIGTVEIGFLHSYGCREGWCFRANGGTGTMRLRADNLTAEGGIGCARFEGAMYGNVRLNTRNNEFGATGRPDVSIALSSGSAMVFEHVEVRRGSGDQAVDCIYVDAGNVDFGTVRIEGGSQPGHGLVLDDDADRITVGTLQATLLLGTHDDTNDSRALWTKSGCDQVTIGQIIADRCDVGWRNDSTGRVRVNTGVLRVREGALSNVQALDLNADPSVVWPSPDRALLLDSDSGLDAWPHNGTSFSNDTSGGGNPTLKVAPETAAEFAQLADATARTYDYDPGVDGYYSLVYEFRLITGGGSYRKIAVTQDFKRVSGVCSLEGSMVTIGTGVQTGLTVAFSIASDDVRVTFTNGTGSTLDGHYWRGVTAGDLPS